MRFFVLNKHQNACVCVCVLPFMNMPENWLDLCAHIWTFAIIIMCEPDSLYKTKEEKRQTIRTYLAHYSQVFYQSTFQYDHPKFVENTLNFLEEKVILRYIYFVDFLHPNLISTIFELCHTLNLSDEHCYITLNLFAKFYLNYFNQLDFQKELTNLKNVWVKHGNKILFRMITCAKIAKKMLCGKFDNRSFDKVLLAIDSNFTCDLMNESELQVLKMINFQVPTTSLFTYVNAIVHLIGSNHIQSLQPGIFNLTNLVYLHWPFVHDWFANSTMTFVGNLQKWSDTISQSIQNVFWIHPINIHVEFFWTKFSSISSLMANAIAVTVAELVNFNFEDSVSILKKDWFSRKECIQFRIPLKI